MTARTRPPRAWLAALLLLAGAAPAARARQIAEDGPLGFALPETRAARALADSARTHLAAGRYANAISDLQELLEKHEGAVLAAERPEHNGRPSQMPVHRGAARHARETLLALPPEGRRLYRERFGPQARLALERARATSDRRALAEVARRYPLTEAAELAWWSLGDVELELGNTRDALGAWKRGLAAHLDLPLDELGPPETWADELAPERPGTRDPDADAGIRARAALARDALSSLSADLAPRQPLLGELRLPGAGEGLGPPPGREADEWPSPLRLPPGSPFRLDHRAFHAVRSGDTVLVSDSLRLLAVNAYSGTTRWESDPPPGWDAVPPSEMEDYFKAVDEKYALIAPAASRNVAVAALQIPVKQYDAADFQRINIMTPLPDRRLFAFDLETGKPLWSHMPPPLWDGDSGSFTVRMRIAGPPVIAGSRVLAPAVRTRGRIDYHVGCFQLETGELLWSANLISGQRETNMFGRPTKEFPAPPLRVEGDRVIALTQLGTLAALDLYTGEILWQVLYDQVPLPKNKHYEPTLRPHTWQNAPPAAAAGIAVATPSDSDDLIGVDLESGAMVWSLPRRSIQAIAGRNAAVDLLIGADESTVYLAGNRIVALEAPSGLQRSAPTRERWVFEDEALEDSAWHAPVLGGDRIVVPTSTVRIDVDRLSGKRLGTAPLRASGNLLLDDGALFVLNERTLNGYFAWDALLSRARRELAERPADAAAALALGRLLHSRGVAEWNDPGDTDRARAWLGEAHELLAAFLDAERAGDHAAAVAEELHGVLRAEARVRADLADTAGALDTLRQARDLAPTPADLRDTLLEELALLRGRAAVARDEAWSRALDVLEEGCADMTVRCEVKADEASGSSLLARFVPVVGSRPVDDSLLVSMPVGLWTRLERLRGHEEQGDLPQVFADLHAILARHGAVELPQGAAGALAAERIGSLVRAGRTQGYEVFEREAQRALEQALPARDRAALAAVARLYPHSPAALEANDTLLEWAGADADAETVARIVLDELPQVWRPAEASEREIGLVLRLAAALAQGGNAEFRAGVLRRLAKSRPDLRSPLAEDRGATLAELAAELAGAEARAAPAPEPRFDETCRSVAVYPGHHEVIGVLPAKAGAPERVLAVHVDQSADRGELLALSAEDPTAPLWVHEIAASRLPRRWDGRLALAGERCLIAIESRVAALDAATGAVLWSRSMQPDELQLVLASDGVALVVVRRPDETYAAHALDAQTGGLIWSVDASDPTLQERPLVGEGRVVFLPNNAGTRRVVLRDLFTGKLAGEVDLPADVGNPRDFGDAAWFEDDKLILPWFQAARTPHANHILAVDLELGQFAWRIPIPSPDGIPRELRSILQHDGRTYLVLDTAPGSGRVTFGEIRELRTNLPAISNPIGDLRLGPSDRLLGVPANERRVRLATPHVFVSSASADGQSAYLRMIHLPYGERWTHTLSVPFPELYSQQNLPLPALSETTVACVYTESRTVGRSATSYVTSLLFLDRAAGVARDARILAAELGAQDRIELLPVGPSLFVLGRGQMEILQ